MCIDTFLVGDDDDDKIFGADALQAFLSRSMTAEMLLVSSSTN